MANQLTNLQALPKSPGLGNSIWKYRESLPSRLGVDAVAFGLAWGIHSKAMNIFIHNDIT